MGIIKKKTTIKLLKVFTEMVSNKLEIAVINKTKKSNQM